MVAGDPDDRRSIVTAKSIPAKKFGINTAEPVSMALRKCPGLVIVKGDWEWYKRCSNNFIAICRTYSPILQQFSVDECFLDMTGRLGGKEPVAVASELKEDIKRRLGFTVNVGIGPNKLLAKMASDFEKPDKVHILMSEDVRERMWPLPVRDLLWVGRKTEERLVAYGIKTIGQLAGLGMGTLTNLFGAKFAAQLHDSANGIDNSPVETEEAEAKSYSAERTFARDIRTTRELDRALFNVACIVAHRIRKDDFRASGVSVSVKTRDFEVRSRQRSMPQPTDITALILNEARKLVPDIWDGITPLRQVGLGVFRLTHEKAWQVTLFEDDNLEFYRQWDREYDDKMRLSEKKDNHYRSGRTRALIFSYPDGELALRAAKDSVRENRDLTFCRRTLEDGTDCFEVTDRDGNVRERHTVVK